VHACDDIEFDTFEECTAIFPGPLNRIVLTTLHWITKEEEKESVFDIVDSLGGSVEKDCSAFPSYDDYGYNTGNGECVKVGGGRERDCSRPTNFQTKEECEQTNKDLIAIAKSGRDRAELIFPQNNDVIEGLADFFIIWEADVEHATFMVGTSRQTGNIIRKNLNVQPDSPGSQKITAFDFPNGKLYATIQYTSKAVGEKRLEYEFRAIGMI
tara:strand:- start:201 stop:836 length:636 start_codon:yes stop_codon:yes gene_type:complete